MTLRRKTLLVLAATIVIGTLVLYAAESSLLLGSFAELEQRDTRQHVVRVLDALAADMAALRSMASDWASWDDAYVFAQDANAAFPQANLLPETFRNLQLDLILILDTQGRVIFGRSFEPNGNQESQVPLGLLSQAGPGSLFLRHDKSAPLSGLVLLPKREMLLSACPILDSQGHGPGRGTLIMGRYLDTVRVKSLRHLTSLPLAFFRLDDEQAPPDAAAAASAMLAAGSDAGGPYDLGSLPSASLDADGNPPVDGNGAALANQILVRPFGDGRVAGYTLLGDIYGQSAMVLRVDVPRRIYQQGQISLRYFLLSLLAIGLILGVTVMLSTEGMMIGRLGQLSAAINQLAAGPGLSARVRVAGQDEITSVASAINHMLAGVEESQRLRKQLLQQSQAHAERLSLLNYIGRSVSTTLNLDQLLEVIYHEVTSVLQSDAFFIALYDLDAGTIEYRVSIDQGCRLPPSREPLNAGLSAHVIATRRSLLIRDYTEAQGSLPQGILWGSMRPPAAWLGVPLLIGTEAAGLICVQSYTPGVYTAADQELLETIADSVAMALEHARLYASLQDANTQLESAIQAKDEMIQNVSHELRTPLTTIRGFTEALSEGLLGDLVEEQQHAIQLIGQRTADLIRLVNGLLTLQTFTAGSLRPGPIQAATLLQNVAENWRALGSTQVSIQVQALGPDLVVYADRDYLREVLDQLMNNALKFTPAGGQICLSAEDAGGWVRLAVSDTGIGIPAEKLNLIFERFYQVNGTTRRTYGGAGIGLAVARKIVEAHGGRIWAESPGLLGCGTTFVMALLQLQPEEPRLPVDDRQPVAA